MRFLDNSQRENIGFSYIVNNINTVSKLGDDRKKAIAPYTKQRSAELEQELQNTETMLGLLTKRAEALDAILHNLCKTKDILPTIKKIGTGMILDEIELFEIKIFSKVCTEIARHYADLASPLHFVEFSDVRAVFELLDPECNGYETFYIYDCFLPELSEQRNRRRRIEQKIQAEQDPEQKKRLLTERADILQEEERLEYEIKKELTKKLEGSTDALLQNAASIGYLDLLIAKAKFFASSHAQKPIPVFEHQPIRFENMYNPYYASILAEKGIRMQRLTLSLKSGVTVLTGANMGGKSIAMKTAALNVLLANCAMYVYAEKAEVPIIDFLYIISDDLQSIESGLSTFGAEMIELKTIIGASGKKDGMIILDELARGTNPDEGRAIVNAVIRLFNKRHSHTFLCTHFDGVRFDGAAHLQVVGISRVDFDRLKNVTAKNSRDALALLQKYMDYSIEAIDEDDVPKNALQIVNLLGLEELDFEGV